MLSSETENHRRNQGKLLYRLFRWVFSVALVLTLTLLLLVYFQIRPVMEQREAQLQHEAALNSARLLKDYMMIRTSELRTIAAAPAMALMEYERQKSLAESLLNLDSSFLELSVVDSNGREFIRVDRSAAVPEQHMMNFSNSPLFIEAKKGISYAGEMKYSQNGEPYQELAVPILREDRFVGMLMGMVGLFPVSEELALFKAGKTGISYIIDRHGRLAAHNERALLLTGNPLTGRGIVEKATAGKEVKAFEEDSFYINERGKNVVASSILVNNLVPVLVLGGGGYGVIVEREVSEALEPLWLLIRLIGTICAGIMLLMAMAIMFGSRSILTPLRQLHEGAMALGAGDMAYRVNIKSGDEMEYLGESFNNMADRLGNAMTGLSASEAQFRAIVENMAEGLVLVDKNGIDIYVNPAFARLTGYSQEQFKGKKAGTLSMDQEEREKAAKEFPLRKKGLSSVRETALVSRSGEKIPMLLSGAPIFDKEGIFQGSVAIFTDLREIKKLEQEREKLLLQTQETLKNLSDSEAQLRAILENMSEGLSLRDRDMKILYVNPALCRMLGYSREEIMAMKNLATAIDKDFRVKAGQRAHEILNRTVYDNVAYERTFLTKSGEEIPGMVSPSPVLDLEGNFRGAVAIFSDLREIKKLQKEREKMLRLAAIGEIAAVVSHEFRNSLGAINNSVYVLQSRIKGPDEKIERNLGIIAQAIASSTRIISNLLDFSRPKEPVFQTVSINEIVNDALSLTGFTDVVKVSAELDYSIPAVKADSDMLRRVFLNMFLNARDAMPEGGEVRVITRQNEGMAEAVVKDSGSGITPEAQAKIFEPFFTTKAKGTGLGLYITKQIIEKHGGEIKVESQPGKGSTFIVKIPLNSRE